MLFNSIEFLIFLPIVITAYFLIPTRRFRYMMLLVASYYFYMSWNPVYVILILASTIVTYITGFYIGKAGKKAKKRFYVILCMALNLGLLLLFKYFNFFNQSISVFFKQFNIAWGVPNFEVIMKMILEYMPMGEGIPDFKLLLPVGISFYTLQALSYTFDVYRGDKEPEKDFFIFALYVSFFPQLVAGPIERSWHLLPQFDNMYGFDYKRVTSGMKLMAWGYFKKVVVADKCAIFVDAVYGDVHQFTGLTLIIATVLFAFQIYCDFAGYTDIAIGSAEIMGFRLMKNFERPYFSKSVAELWRRWHMSLMNWFRDYMYISMGGNRVSRWRHRFNVLATFTMSGLWHGANWTFVIWGFMNGLMIVISAMTQKMRDRFKGIIGLDKLPALDRFWKVLVTFSLFCFGAIFFRSENLSDALYVVMNLFNGLGSQLMNITTYSLDIGMSAPKAVSMVVSIAILETVHYFQRTGSVREKVSRLPIYARFGLYYGLIMWIIVFGEFDQKVFYYFQF